MKPNHFALVLVALPLLVGCAEDSGAGGRAGSASTTAATELSCPKTRALPDGEGIAVDYVDFLYWHGRTYLSNYRPQQVSMIPAGDQIGTVTCNVEELTGDGRHEIVGPYLDGNASVLRVGAAIREVHGFPAACRLVAAQDGSATIYLAQREFDGHSEARPCATRS